MKSDPEFGGATRRLPILVQCTIGADGSSHRDGRIYCSDRGTSVPVETCRRCPACVGGSEMDGDGAIHCRPRSTDEVDGAEDPNLVGGALRRGVTIVDPAVALGFVVACLAETNNGVIVVAEPSGRVCGVIHESSVLPELLAKANHRANIADLAVTRACERMAMSSPVPESMPLREALLQMAHSHNRCVVAVNAQGEPIGVLWDVDAMHAMSGRGNASPKESP